MTYSDIRRSYRKLVH